jgi:hypothetical protein
MTTQHQMALSMSKKQRRKLEQLATKTAKDSSRAALHAELAAHAIKAEHHDLLVKTLRGKARP